MRLDLELEALSLSKKEFNIISSAVAIFHQEIYWALDFPKNDIDKSLFEKFEEKFTFSLEELNYVESELNSLTFTIKNTNAVEVYLFFLEQIPKKPIVIYTALNECIKNFEYYEIAILRGEDAYQELINLSKEFKEKVIDVIKNTLEEGY